MTALTERFFLITIDTEGDNLWGQPKTVTVDNARFLPRFQSTCEKYGFKPTYLTNYEMAICPEFQKFGKSVISKNTAEIGMHLHAWYSPPDDFKLTDNDSVHQPYLMEYPDDVMNNKVSFMTKLLQDTFKSKMVSHRAGRWGFDECYARILNAQGYKVDCSVIPHLSMRQWKGDPTKNGGPDYTTFPDQPYFLNLDDIRQPGDSTLLEIPMTVVPFSRPGRHLFKGLSNITPLTKKIYNRLYPIYRLRPNGFNLDQMLYIIQNAAKAQKDHIEFMLHSSEFMPGGSPTFKTNESIENLYKHLEIIFQEIHLHFKGSTLKEFYDHFTESSGDRTR